MNYLIIDGSYGEGGGQIVRTAVSLSTITGKPIQITNIRSKRNKPGLRTQHFSAVKAVADLFHAKVENLKVGADWIRFTPSHHTHLFGNTDYFDYGITKIDIGTAGSIANVLMTIIPAISFSGISHDLQIVGGTDVQYGPTIDYLRYVVREIYASIGINFDIDVIRRGYYPKGGGIVNVQIKAINLPSKKLSTTSSQLSDPDRKIKNIHNASGISESIVPAAIPTVSIIRAPSPELMKIKIATVCSQQLPKHVAERQLSSAISNLTNNGVDTTDDSLFTITCESSLSPGSSILVFSTSRNDNDDNSDGWYIGGDSIGQRGKRAETVGIEASNRFLQNYLKNVPVDYLLADMLLVPLSLIKGRNRFRVAKITEHLKTNLYVVSRIVDGCKYYINDVYSSTNPNLEQNIVGYNTAPSSKGYIVNLES
ncbi:MAG: RNA 3'-terminal phosphate cyclase [Nitrososphaeraceae archaeon]